MLTIIYPYRNREVNRLKNSFESLKQQTHTDFKVYLVDYGSYPETAREVENLCKGYSFITYTFEHTRFQPWNKSKALNSVIRNLNTGFCFVADVDMIFHPEFVERAEGLQQKDVSIYFQVGFLKQKADMGGKGFKDFSKYRKSTFEATGLSMFPVNVLKEIRGFDEFYHFWGAEDTDLHVRIQSAGHKIEFYDKEVLMLHQWHPSYRSKESNTLTPHLQVNGIVRINHAHLKNAIKLKRTEVNSEEWGKILSEPEVLELEKEPVHLILNNQKSGIDEFLYGILPEAKNRILKIDIIEDIHQFSKKFRIKKLLGKNVPEYYSLKEINDKILLHLISFYRNKPYMYKVTGDLKRIEFAVKL